MSTAVQASTEIRSFDIDIPEEKLDEPRGRIGATRWPSKELVADRSQGVQLEALQASRGTGWTSTTSGGSRRA